ncbi:MAG: hypothetical protein LBT87_01845 [Treponema sp.]|jgi:signal transduction histidine kinase|nr:hypothetical protein [Treponema sp.]
MSHEIRTPLNAILGLSELEVRFSIGWEQEGNDEWLIRRPLEQAENFDYDAMHKRPEEFLGK